MIHQYEDLPDLMGIKDYSKISAGDIVEIPGNSIMLKSMMKNALGRERMAMEEHAQRIRCKLEIVSSKKGSYYRFEQ